MKQFSFIFIILSSLLFINCSKDDSTPKGNDLGNYNIILKVNGEVWKGNNGQAAINDASGTTQNAYILLVASIEDSTSGDPDFTSMLSGASLNEGNTIIMKGGFNNGEYFGIRYNGVDYVTNKAPEGQQVGLLKILSYGTKITGELSGVLYSENGDTIEVSEGAFSFDVMHF